MSSNNLAHEQHCERLELQISAMTGFRSPSASVLGCAGALDTRHTGVDAACSGEAEEPPRRAEPFPGGRSLSPGP